MKPGTLLWALTILLPQILPGMTGFMKKEIIHFALQNGFTVPKPGFWEIFKLRKRVMGNYMTNLNLPRLIKFLKKAVMTGALIIILDTPELKK